MIKLILILSLMFIVAHHQEGVQEFILKKAVFAGQETDRLRVTRDSRLLMEEWVPPGASTAIAVRTLQGELMLYRETKSGHEEVVWQLSRVLTSGLRSRCAPLIFYDAIYNDNQCLVLYSVGCQILLDRVECDSDAGYRVVSTTSIFRQVDSGVTPRLVDAGTIFLHDNTLGIGFRTLGSTHVHRGRDNPYEFWKIEDGEAVEITDDDELWRLRVEHSHKLDDEDRPTLTRQITRPEPNPDESAAPADDEEQEPADPEP